MGAAACSSCARKQPLHYAAAVGETRLARILLDMGGSLNSRDTSGSTPLFIAAERGHTDTVKLLVSCGAEIATQNASGETPFYVASLIGHTAVCRALIRASDDWDSPTLYGDGWTPLMAAVLSNRTGLVVELLQASKRKALLMNATNRYGQSALHLVARKGYMDLSEILLDHGADPSLKDANGHDPCKVAKFHGHITLSKALAEACSRFRKKGERESGRRSKKKKKKKEKKKDDDQFHLKEG